MQYTIADEFDVSAQRFWELFFDEDYNRELWKHLKVGYERLEFDRKGEGSDLVITRKLRLAPERELPSIMQKFVKGTLSYEQSDRYAATDGKMTSKSQPSVAADKIESHGVQRVESLGDDKCRRVYEGVMKCNIPLVGGKIESYLVDEIKQSYARATEFTRTWIAKHK